MNNCNKLRDSESRDTLFIIFGRNLVCPFKNVSMTANNKRRQFRFYDFNLYVTKSFNPNKIKVKGQGENNQCLWKELHLVYGVTLRGSILKYFHELFGVF